MKLQRVFTIEGVEELQLSVPGSITVVTESITAILGHQACHVNYEPPVSQNPANREPPKRVNVDSPWVNVAITAGRTGVGATVTLGTEKQDYDFVSKLICILGRS